MMELRTKIEASRRGSGRRRKRGGDRGRERGRMVRFVAKEVISGEPGSRLGFGEIGGVAVGLEEHVTGMKADDGIGMRGTVVEEVCARFGRGLSADSLGSGQGAKGDKERRVDGPAVVQENANDLLQPREATVREGWRCVGRSSELSVSPVLGLLPMVRRILRPCAGR